DAPPFRSTAAPNLPNGVQVVLCASAPDTPEIEDRMRRTVPRHPNVHWINRMVPVDQVVQLYSHASVFVCPSVYEPFGLINLEAMACGTAVVASAVGGIVEVVEDGKTGILLPPSRPDELAAAIRRLLDAPAETLAALDRAGRRLAFVSNNSRATGADLRERLHALGVTVAQHALSPLEIIGEVITERWSRSRVLVMGAREMEDAIAGAGHAIV